MGWDVLQQLRNRTIDRLQFRGETVGTAQTIKALMTNVNNEVLIAWAPEGTALPQKRVGFAKGCILFVDATGPANQVTKGVYENVGTAKLSRFNVLGKVVDPEIALPHKHILLGQHNGLAKDVAISGVIEIDEDGVTTFGSAANQNFEIVAIGISDAVDDADGEVAVYDANIATSDVIVATVFESAHLAAVRKAECRDGHARVFLTTAGGTGTRIQFIVVRPAGTSGTNPTSTEPPTTATSTTEPPLSTDSPPTTLAPTTPAPTTAV